ncbi:MAG: DUF1963 domain-containing protein [Lachnospiraceae bacterium]|nr:DUF1963 domain-containing protein [Lachnospiraceae bacterium]
MENKYAEKASEKVKKIVARMKEVTAMEAYKLTIIPNSQPDIFDSKFGGVPYWDMTKDYPVDCEGDKMMLLAQINFTKAALNDERLPQQGILQFFIAAEDDVYGMDWDEADSQRNFRVVYHEQIDETITEEQVLALDIPVATSEDNEWTPVFKEAAVSITKTTTYLGTEDYRFDSVFAEVVKELYGEDIKEQGYYEYLSEEDRDYIFDEYSNVDHWILGYPYFTQSDPREFRADDYYNTLLFQMDSDMIDHEDYVLWGDCGVANFFINDEALRKKDFSRVLYNWDCC